MHKRSTSASAGLRRFPISPQESSAALKYTVISFRLHVSGPSAKDEYLQGVRSSSTASASGNTRVHAAHIQTAPPALREGDNGEKQEPEIIPIRADDTGPSRAEEKIKTIHNKAVVPPVLLNACLHRLGAGVGSSLVAHLAEESLNRYTWRARYSGVPRCLGNQMERLLVSIFHR